IIQSLSFLSKIVHPWMPFITEEIWHLLKERNDKDCIIVAEWTKKKIANKEHLLYYENFKEVVTKLRNYKNEKGISPKEVIQIFYIEDETIPKSADTRVQRDQLWHSQELLFKLVKAMFNPSSDYFLPGTYSFLSGNLKFQVLPSGKFDIKAEKEKLNKELEYNKGFLQSVQIKLSNEKKKQADAEAKIKAIEEQLAALK